MIFAAILLILDLLLILIDFMICWEEHRISLSLIIFIITCVTVGIIFNEKTVNPIEVYKGNTTLKIIYEKGIPVDSIVILKK